MAFKVPQEEQGQGRCCCICIISLGLLLALLAIIWLVGAFANKQPQYYAAIDTISGLDPATNVSKPALGQVQFNLTLGVKSKNPFYSECFESGTNVTVMYLNVEIASGTYNGQACAAGWKPEQMVRMPVVARWTGAWLPDSMLDSLMVDIRRGVALFDVWLWFPSTPGDDRKLVVCRGRRIAASVDTDTAGEEQKFCRTTAEITLV